ncbi:bark storage protein A-like isoform X2 [Salvia miltiorrhiza]|uniref:bark storage protein A-like isoform X2 n=2 Tax=Salvia miltiorrhiza TaxID=226208 RepID=UPI0025AC741C|nr:bark storage protein A-like isoform X2 [Salvia miltiorrhiza]
MSANQLVLAAIFALFLLPAFGFANGRQKSLAIIKEINKNGPYLGLITVYSAEEDAFFATGAFKNDSRYPYVDLSGKRFRVGRIEGKKVIYVRCGIGMVNAAAATQQMVDLFDIYGLIHFGVSGNTNTSLSIGDVVVPKEFINTGLWDWMKTNGTVPIEDIAKLDVKDYNLPKRGNNYLGRIAYRSERYYSEAGEPNVPQEKVWFEVTTNWLQLATSLQGIELERCVNSTLCLETKPKVVVGVRGSTANMFVNNGDYRDFLYQTFGVSSADMESSAVVMTSFSNGYPVIVIRGMSDLAGGQNGTVNDIDLFESLASTNVAKVVLQFIKLLSRKLYPF